jgi:hypothetical protein
MSWFRILRTSRGSSGNGGGTQRTRSANPHLPRVFVGDSGVNQQTKHLLFARRPHGDSQGACLAAPSRHEITRCERRDEIEDTLAAGPGDIMLNSAGNTGSCSERVSQRNITLYEFCGWRTPAF